MYVIQYVWNFYLTFLFDQMEWEKDLCKWKKKINLFGHKGELNKRLKLSEIDAQWLNRKVCAQVDSKEMEPEDIVKKVNSVFEIMALVDKSAREIEKRLFQHFSHQKFQLVRLLVKNRHVIYYGTLLNQAQN